LGACEAQIIEVEKPVEVIVEVIQIQEPRWEIYEVTAYTAGFESTGKTPEHPEYGITASGQRVWEMWTIACPPHLPFGTLIFIRELQWVYGCQDRGSAITAGHLDIYMEELERALAFGRQQMHIFILPATKEIKP
jgi:3D (Asp-Asp-Asp) domain-containing protein